MNESTVMSFNPADDPEGAGPDSVVPAGSYLMAVVDAARPTDKEGYLKNTFLLKLKIIKGEHSGKVFTDWFSLREGKRAKTVQLLKYFGLVDGNEFDCAEENIKATFIGRCLKAEVSCQKWKAMKDGDPETEHNSIRILLAMLESDEDAVRLYEETAGASVKTSDEPPWGVV